MGGLIPAEIAGLLALVFTLGLKHGFDPDHLVAIDGMTRSGKSRWCGLFFSLGHGLVVTLVGLAVALAARDLQAPAWLELTGTVLSASVLLALGVANLARVWLGARLARVSHPAVIASIGAAFALSFDTISHALLFSFAGWIFAALLGLVFTLGMVATDALNGWWVAKMMAGAERRAACAARWMSVAVALLCLSTATLALHGLAEKLSLMVSAATLAVIASVFAAAVLRSRSAYREAHS